MRGVLRYKARRDLRELMREGAIFELAALRSVGAIAGTVGTVAVGSTGTGAQRVVVKRRSSKTVKGGRGRELAGREAREGGQRRLLLVWIRAVEQLLAFATVCRLMEEIKGTSRRHSRYPTEIHAQIGAPRVNKQGRERTKREHA